MKQTTALGAAVIGLTLPVHFVVPETVSVQIAALILALIAGAYIGFAAAEGAFKSLVVELSGAAMFAGVALLGLFWNPIIIPIGIMSHALWDYAHHNGRFGAAVPQWYIPFCAVIDLIVGGALLVKYAF